jgi:uncharacterized protein (TIGR00369 family)
MKKIINPFAVMAGNEAYNCFGCAPANNLGLHLEFWLDGNELVAVWHPKKAYEGWNDILHGGIQATIMDEAAAWLVMVSLKTAGVTASMNVNFLKPVHISMGRITVRAKLYSQEKRIALIDCSLTDGNEEVCSTAKISCFCFPEHVARTKYNYPGAEMFFES